MNAINQSEQKPQDGIHHSACLSVRAPIRRQKKPCQTMWRTPPKSNSRAKVDILISIDEDQINSMRDLSLPPMSEYPISGRERRPTRIRNSRKNVVMKQQQQEVFSENYIVANRPRSSLELHHELSSGINGSSSTSTTCSGKYPLVEEAKEKQRPKLKKGLSQRFHHNLKKLNCIRSMKIQKEPPVELSPSMRALTKLAVDSALTSTTLSSDSESSPPSASSQKILQQDSNKRKARILHDDLFHLQ